jgi:hypothetical protein
MPREVFVAGQILTAAEMNIVSDQTVMSFAGTAARGSAIPTPSEGMAAYLNDSNILSLYDGAAWKNSLGVTGGILQVVSTTKTDTFTTTSTSFVDITGFSVSISPSSTTSKILVIFNVSVGADGGTNAPTAQIMRDSTAIAIGDAAGSRTRATSLYYAGNGGGANAQNNFSNNFLDSPNTTSSVTYKIQVRSNSAAQTTAINRGTGDTDGASTARGVSTITLMEVAG